MTQLLSRGGKLAVTPGDSRDMSMSIPLLPFTSHAKWMEYLHDYNRFSGNFSRWHVLVESLGPVWVLDDEVQLLLTGVHAHHPQRYASKTSTSCRAAVVTGGIPWRALGRTPWLELQPGSNRHGGIHGADLLQHVMSVGAVAETNWLRMVRDSNDNSGCITNQLSLPLWALINKFYSRREQEYDPRKNGNSRWMRVYE